MLELAPSKPNTIASCYNVYIKNLLIEGRISTAMYYVSSPKNWTFAIWEILVKFKLGIDEKDNIYRKPNYRDFEIS